MATALHIDGLDLSSKSFKIKPGATAWEVLTDLACSVRIEHVPTPEPERELSVEAAEFIASYEPGCPPCVLAVFWRRHSLDAEEFDTVEEARRFLDGGEEYGSLAGEAIVDIDRDKNRVEIALCL